MIIKQAHKLNLLFKTKVFCRWKERKREIRDRRQVVVTVVRI